MTAIPSDKVVDFMHGGKRYVGSIPEIRLRHYAVLKIKLHQPFYSISERYPRKLSNNIQALSRLKGITTGSLINDNLGDHYIESIYGLCPPVFGYLLMGKCYDVSTLTRRQITHDRCFKVDGFFVAHLLIPLSVSRFSSLFEGIILHNTVLQHQSLWLSHCFRFQYDGRDDAADRRNRASGTGQAGEHESCKERNGDE